MRTHTSNTCAPPPLPGYTPPVGLVLLCMVSHHSGSVCPCPGRPACRPSIVNFCRHLPRGGGSLAPLAQSSEPPTHPRIRTHPVEQWHRARQHCLPPGQRHEEARGRYSSPHWRYSSVPLLHILNMRQRLSAVPYIYISTHTGI